MAWSDDLLSDLKLFKAPTAIALAVKAFFKHRPCCGLFNGPSGRNARKPCAPANAVVLGNMPPRAAIRRHPNIAFIYRLLCASGPFTIARRIVSVIIYAFYGQGISVSMRHCPRPEHGEIPPFFTDSNATFAVMPISRIAFVITSASHALPGVVEAGAGSAMLRKSSTGQFWQVVTARLNLSLSQIRPVRSGGFPTRTFTFPESRSTGRVARLLNHHKVAKALTGKINQSRVFCHAG